MAENGDKIVGVVQSMAQNVQECSRSLELLSRKGKAASKWTHTRKKFKTPRATVKRGSFSYAILTPKMCVLATFLVGLTVCRVFVDTKWMKKHASCFTGESVSATAWSIPETQPRPCPNVTYSTPSNFVAPHNICLTSLTDGAARSRQSRLSRLISPRCRNYDSVASLIRSNHENYAARHGYRYVWTEDMVDNSRPPAWSKIKAVQAQLENGCEWVMWLDADVVIMNPEVRIESFIDVEADLVATPDRSFGVSSGVWLIQNSDWSHLFLQEWWDSKTFVRAKGLSLSGDNKAFGHLVQEELVKKDNGRIRITPNRCTMNSNGLFVNKNGVDVGTKRSDWQGSAEYYHHGDFIAHASGIDRKHLAIQLLLDRTL